MNTFKRIALGLLLAVALALGTIAATAQHAEAMPKPGTPAHWQKNYRTDFTTWPRCERWGFGAVIRIPYVDNFYCHRITRGANKGKYAIDLHWEDIPCGTGSGSCSWVVPRQLVGSHV